MRPKTMWSRMITILGLLAAITALAIEASPTHGLGNVTSQGVHLHQASQWHNAGFTGTGVKVGVIDLGFEGIQALLGTELPAIVNARCYTDIGRFTQNLPDCENGDNHGTLVSESLVDMAPGIILYIAKPSPFSAGDLRASVDWMISEEVKIINHSLGWPLDGPGDGTSPFSSSPLKTIDHAVDNGVLWINATSNDAENTWFTNRPFPNPDGDPFVNFAGTDEGMSFRVRPGDIIVVEMRWEDTWGEASRDLDLLLLNQSNQIIGGSFDLQNGGLQDYPLEWFAGSFTAAGQYSLAIGQLNGAVPGWTQLLLWGVGPLEHHTLTGSTYNPEESANTGMMAVGAASWHTPHIIARYSGRGPTTDGRIKPEIVGADCAITTADNNFCGTSQASPHVAGMAALVLQRFPHYSATDLSKYLKHQATQRLFPDPNHTWGHGFAKLPPLNVGPPTIITLTPGTDFLTITWATPTGAPDSAIIAYDLRHIESAAHDKSDTNWTVVDNAWTTGSGTLNYRISGLSHGTRYDFQVRAVTALSNGPWSATAVHKTLTKPATWEATRSFSPPSVVPSGKVVVTITANGYGEFGGVTETLPSGFNYVSTSLEDEAATINGQEVRFTLSGETAFTYTVTAPNTEGAYSFSGILTNFDREDVPVGGALTITVTARDPLIIRYDTNNNGSIEKNEVIAAINDYLFGTGDEAISKSDVIKLINLYLFD